MRKAMVLACIATFATSSLALADSVTIRTDSEPTGSIVVRERQNPDVIIKKKKKIVVREDNDPDVVIRNRVTID